jgi:Glycosyltransferases involved in cell wall biogenesis
MIKNELSILIPTYNDVCVDLVRGLVKQCKAIKYLRYQVLVADDGSTDPAVIEANQPINGILNCSYVVRGENCGRRLHATGWHTKRGMSGCSL